MEDEPRKLIHRRAKLAQFCMNFIALWSKDGELSNTAELSVFKLVFVSILTYGHDSWVMTKKMYYLRCKRQTCGFCESAVQHKRRTEVQHKRRPMFELKVFSEQMYCNEGPKKTMQTTYLQTFR